MTHDSKVEALAEQFAVGWVNLNLDVNTQDRSAFVKEFLHTHHAELDAELEGMKETLYESDGEYRHNRILIKNEALTAAQSLLRNT